MWFAYSAPKCVPLTAERRIKSLSKSSNGNTVPAGTGNYLETQVNSLNCTDTHLNSLICITVFKYYVSKIKHYK